MTKNVEQRSSTWRKMKGALSSLTGGSSSNSVGYGGYSGYSGASGQGFSRDIDRLVDISEAVKSLIREKDSDGVVSYSYHDERQTAQGLQGKLEALEKYSSQVSTYLKDKIDQPFYKAMDDVGARLEALSIASYKTGNTIGYKRTEVVKDTYGNPIGTRKVTPDEIGLEELYQVDNPYKDSLQASYQDYKNSDAYKDHKLTETEFLMASHHTRAFDYESIRDQQEAIEMWRDLALGAGVIILAVFCPPAAAVVGFTLAAADMYSAISGKDWGTGRELSTEERVLRGGFALLELVPGIGYLNDVAKSGGKVAVKNVVKNSLREGFEQGAKNFDNMVKLTSKFGDNVLSKLDDFGRQADQVFNKLASKGADSLSTGLKNVDQGLSQAAQNFRLNMGLEPQLVSGAMPSPGSSSINKITNKLDDFSKARKLRVSNLDEVGEPFKATAKIGDDVPKTVRFSAEWEEFRKSFPDAGLSKNDIDEIVNLKPGSRYDPEAYLSPIYIKQHRELFDEGVAAFVRDDSNLKRFGQFGRDDGAFVFPKHVADAMVKEADGDPRVLEALLGLDPGSLGEKPIMIQPNKVDNLRIPSGNEGGSKNNIQWRPGGKTYPGGVPEAVIDPVPIEQVTLIHLWE